MEAGETLANVVVSSSNSEKVEETKSFAEAFPGLFPEEEIEEEYIIHDDIFYLWDTLETTFKIYKCARNYLDYHLGLDTKVIIELTKAYNLDIIETLENIPYIHAGYIKVILEHRNLENGG